MPCLLLELAPALHPVVHLLCFSLVHCLLADLLKSTVAGSPRLSTLLRLQTQLQPFHALIIGGYTGNVSKCETSFYLDSLPCCNSPSTYLVVS